MNPSRNGITHLEKKVMNQEPISNIENEIRRLYKKVGEYIDNNELFNAINAATLLSFNLQKKQGGLRWAERAGRVTKNG